MTSHVTYETRFRCPSCGWETTVVTLTLATLRPPTVGDKEWGTCRGACNNTGALPERHFELVAAARINPLLEKLKRPPI